MTEIPVFTPDEAKSKRGCHAEAMLICSECGHHKGVHICTPPRIDKSRGGTHIELWQCLNCHFKWWEKYIIKSPNGGVVRDLFKRIMNVEGEE